MEDITDRDSGAVGLLALNALDVNNVFLSVDLSDFASLLTLVMTPEEEGRYFKAINDDSLCRQCLYKIPLLQVDTQI